MTIEITNVNLTPELRTEYVARLVFEEVNQAPTRLDISWDDDHWIVEDTKEETEVGRKVKHEEHIATGESASTFAAFEAAIFKLNAQPTLEMKKKQLGQLVKAIAHGFSQPGADATLPMYQKEIVSEMAHSMNRHGLVSNDDVDEFVALLYKEMKL